MARERNRRPEEICGILATVLARLDPEQRIALWRAWDEAVGEPIASHARPERLEDGVLVVAVSSHTWAQELQLLKRDLIANVNRVFGDARVRDVFFVTAAAEPAVRAQPGRQAPRRRQR